MDPANDAARQAGEAEGANPKAGESMTDARPAVQGNAPFANDAVLVGGSGNSQTSVPLGSVAERLASLVCEYHVALYRYAYRLTGNSADAEDLTQQTYLLAQQRLHQLADETRARAWLFIILRNCFLKQLRRQRPLLEGAAGIDLQEAPAAFELETPFDQEKLQTALNELPEEFKLVLLMYYFDDCSYKQIAEELGIPIGTVMSRLSRGKNHLRARLAERQPESDDNQVALAAAEHTTAHADRLRGILR